jgi:hypothetical protein
MLADATWQNISWRTGTKGKLKARFAAVRLAIPQPRRRGAAQVLLLPTRPGIARPAPPDRDAGRGRGLRLLDLRVPGLAAGQPRVLDSVNELYFVQRHLGFLERAGWRVLDVGAGYGRLAHRALCAVPALGQYVCTDAVPESTFLCDYYLQFRGVRERADVVPLHQLERLAGRRYDLAVNIHTFSEMSHAAIDGWLARIAALGVPWLLVIPNDGEHFLTTEAELHAGGKRARRPFDALFGANRYELAVNEPVFADVTIREFMCVTDCFFLFRRRGAS